MPDVLIRSYRFTVNGLLRTYREQAGFSQEQLAAFSEDLLLRGLLDRSFSQSAIARWEKDPNDGASPENRVRKLQSHILESYAVLLEHALRRAGYESARADELLKHLRIANERRVTAREVSPFALEVDALMAAWPRWLRDMAQQAVRTTLTGMGQVYERVHKPPDQER